MGCAGGRNASDIPYNKRGTEFGCFSYVVPLPSHFLHRRPPSIPTAGDARRNRALSAGVGWHLDLHTIDTTCAWCICVISQTIHRPGSWMGPPGQTTASQPSQGGARRWDSPAGVHGGGWSELSGQRLPPREPQLRPAPWLLQHRRAPGSPGMAERGRRHPASIALLCHERGWGPPDRASPALVLCL